MGEVVAGNSGDRRGSDAHAAAFALSIASTSAATAALAALTALVTLATFAARRPVAGRGAIALSEGHRRFGGRLLHAACIARRSRLALAIPFTTPPAAFLVLAAFGALAWLSAVAPFAGCRAIGRHAFAGWIAFSALATAATLG